MKYAIVSPTTKYYKNETYYKYYKYDSWNQPILTSNTSSSLMQIQVSSYYKNNDKFNGWRSFESNQGDEYCWCADPSDTSAFMIIKFSEPLYLRSIDVKNRTTTYSFLQDYILQGSNDSGVTWDTIYSGACPNFEASGEWNLFKSSGQNPKYAWLKIVATSNYGEGYTAVGNIFIDVNLAGSTTYKEVLSTDNYDFIKEFLLVREVSSTDDYDFTKEVLTPCLIVRPTTKYYKNSENDDYDFSKEVMLHYVITKEMEAD